MVAGSRRPSRSEDMTSRISLSTIRRDVIGPVTSSGGAGLSITGRYELDGVGIKRAELSGSSR